MSKLLYNYLLVKLWYSNMACCLESSIYRSFFYQRHLAFFRLRSIPAMGAIWWLCQAVHVQLLSLHHLCQWAAGHGGKPIWVLRRGVHHRSHRLGWGLGGWAVAEVKRWDEPNGKTGEMWGNPRSKWRVFCSWEHHLTRTCGDVNSKVIKHNQT